MTSAPESSKTGLHYRAVGALIPAIKAKISGGMIAGLFFVATGFGPDEWFRRLFTTLHLPERLVAGLQSFDPRVALVGVGVILIGIDILLRHYRHQPAVPTGSTVAPSELILSSATTSKATSPSAPVDQSKELPLPDKPSIAVLPFQNLSGDPEQEYFCDGVVDDITTALSRAKWLFVIARNSAFTFKGKNVDARQIGRELGVRYLLQGSVRRSGDHLRINGQLIEAATGKNIWADHFDGEYRSVFELQDRITDSVVGAVEPNLNLAETERANRKPPIDLNAYDLYLRAHFSMRSLKIDAYIEAEAFLRRAIEIDPNYSSALAYLADCIGRQTFMGARAWDQGGDEVVKFAKRAVEADPEDAVALAGAAWGFWQFGRPLDAASEFAERALRLQPNSVYVCVQSAAAILNCGEIERAKTLYERALRLNPLDPRNYLIYLGLGAVALYQKRFEEAERILSRTIDLAPEMRLAWRMRAATLYYLGRSQEAHEAAIVARSFTLAPNLEEIVRRTNTRHEWMLDMVIQGLKGAGYDDTIDNSHG